MTSIKDVALEAGVSVNTVSRVLNNRGYISQATRQKVYTVIKALDYQPNEVARSLFRKKTNIIGLIVPNVQHPFFGELTSYLEYYAYKNNYKLLLCNSQIEMTKEKEYIDMLKRNQVDGIIMASHTLEVDEYLNLDMPLVTIDRCISDKIPYIASDNYEGGRMATNLLIEKGCKKIVSICGNLDLKMLSNKRNDAFIDVALKNNIDHYTIQTDFNGFELEQYKPYIIEMLEKYPDTDGIFASSDMIAAQAVKVCQQFNKRIPQDIKVIGYDDLKVMALVTPPMTTIRQPIEKMCELAMELILKQINGEEVSKENILPVTLIERSTTS